ncbi:MAG: hypothetical protein Q7S80_02110 [bacterium]|nr:hypothetical protein [bacterium]
MAANSTQQAISIAGIKDGVVVMKDGSYRLVLQVAATNFALKSEQEQNSIIFQYQSFLNSLHFPIEIVISSRRLDLTPYIAKIEKLGEAQTSEILKMQTTDYVDFLRKLIDIANIMKKTFYAVVSFEPVSIQKIGFLGSLFGKKSAFDHLKISDADYKAHADQLKERAATIATGLGSMGLHCFQLSTEDLIELFYLMYNPDEASKERLKDATMLASPVIMSESEFKGTATVAETQPAAAEGGMIDNTAVVEAQRREETQSKKQEDLKAGEKEIKANPATTTPAKSAAGQPAATAASAPTQPAQPTSAPVNPVPNQSTTNPPTAAPLQASPIPPANTPIK